MIIGSLYYQRCCCCCCCKTVLIRLTLCRRHCGGTFHSNVSDWLTIQFNCAKTLSTRKPGWKSSISLTQSACWLTASASQQVTELTLDSHCSTYERSYNPSVQGASCQLFTEPGFGFVLLMFQFSMPWLQFSTRWSSTATRWPALFTVKMHF